MHVATRKWPGSRLAGRIETWQAQHTRSRFSDVNFYALLEEQVRRAVYVDNRLARALNALTLLWPEPFARGHQRCSRARSVRKLTGDARPRFIES